MSTEVQIIACPHPFKTEKIQRAVRAGGTITQLIRESGLDKVLLECTRTFIFLDDELIPREKWHQIRPRPGQLLGIRVVPGDPTGGDGDKDPFRTIASLSILAGSIFVPSLLPKAWPLWTHGAAGAAVGIGGILLTNALIPPQKQKFSAGSRDPVYSITGTRNIADPYGPIPRIYGKHRVYPRYAALPCTELHGSDEYLRALFCVGYGELELSSHKIGETLISDLDDAEIEIYHSDAYTDGTWADQQFAIYPDTPYQDPLTIELTNAAGWQQRTTQTNTDEIGFDLSFPSGLYVIDDGDRDATSVEIEVQYAVASSGNWISFGNTVYMTLTEATQPQKSQVTLGNTITGVTSGATGTLKWFYYRTVIDRTDRENPVRKYYVERLWVEVTSGTFIEGENVKVNPSEDQATTETITSPTLTIQGRYEELHRHGWKIPVDRNQYDIRWRRVTADHGSDYVDSTYITALRSIRHEPPVKKEGLILVALRIKATGQLNGIIDQYNCIAESILWNHNGTAWGVDKSRNPAWAYTDVLIGSSNKRAVTPWSKLNHTKLKAWADNCTSRGVNFDAVIDYKTTVFELLNDIASAGRASFGLVDNKYTVVEDIQQTTYIQHFSLRNSWGFRTTRPFPTLPHALKGQFINADADYIQDEITICDDGYYDPLMDTPSDWDDLTPYSQGVFVKPTTPNNFYYRCITGGTSGENEPVWPTTIRETKTDGSVTWICEAQATIFETLNYFGITDPDIVWKNGRYDIACARLRPETHEFYCDIEHIRCTRGDLVRLTHDVLMVGLGAARVKSVTLDGSNNVTAAVFDDHITMVAGKSYGARFRLDDGSSTTATIVTNPGEQTSVSFNPIIPAADAPDAGDLVLFGELDEESIECIVTRIEGGPDLSAKISVVAAAPAVHSADTGTIPEWDANITQPPQENRTPPKPSINTTGIKWDYHKTQQQDDGTYQVYVIVPFELDLSGMSIGQTISLRDVVNGFQAQYRHGTTGNWIELPLLNFDERKFSFPAQNGETYYFRVRSLGLLPGLVSDWASGNYAVAISTIRPSDVTGLQVKGGGTTFAQPDCEIEWTAPGSTILIKSYKIEVRKTDDTLLRTVEWPGDQTSYNRTFQENQYDNAGSAVNSIKFNVWARSRWDDLSENAATLTATNAAPADVSGLTATSWMKGVEFRWNSHSANDFSHFIYQIKVETGSWSAWYRTTGTRQMRFLTSAEIAAYGADATVYIEIKAVDTFGTESGVQAANADAGSLNIAPTDITTFDAEVASNLFPRIPVPDGIAFSNNDPSSGYVSWTSGSIWLNGTEYSITGTNSNNTYIFWKDKASTFSTSNSNPLDIYGSDWDPKEDFVIAINTNGVAQVGYFLLGNAIIGSAAIKDLAVGAAKIDNLAVTTGKINDLAVTDAKINDLDASKIQTGTILITGLSQDIRDSYGSIVPDPTFSLTTGASDYDFWNTSASGILWGSTLGEDGPGIQFVADGTQREAIMNDGAGSEKFIPCSKNNKILVQARTYKQVAFDGNLYCRIAFYDETKTIITAATVDIEPPSADGYYHTVLDQTQSTNSDCHFITVRLRVNGGSTGNAHCDSLYINIEPDANFRHSSDYTYIDGGKIYTNTITATQINGAGLGTLTISSGKIVLSASNAIEVNTTDGLVVKNTANILLESGGDLIMTPHDSSPSKVVWEDSGAGTYDIEIKRDTTYDTLEITPTTSGQCGLSIGLTAGGGARYFSFINLYAASEILIQGVYDGTHTAGITLTPGSNLITIGTYAKNLTIDGGAITLPSVIGTSAPNNSIYRDSSNGKLYWKDNGGTSNVLY